MNDITLEEMIAAISDESLKTWWTSPTPALPADFTMASFLTKTLHACSLAAATKNATLDPGQKILGYPLAANSPIETSPDGKFLFFRRTASVASFVAIDLDDTYATNG